jgi:hypothetical protein
MISIKQSHSTILIKIKIRVYGIISKKIIKQRQKKIIDLASEIWKII